MIGIFENIPVSTKKSSVTTAIYDNNGFTRRKAGDKRTYAGRVHIDPNSLVSWRTGCSDSHPEEAGGITSGLLTA